jgi:hypothetical protein
MNYLEEILHHYSPAFAPLREITFYRPFFLSALAPPAPESYRDPR